jgi:hypothetical protein
MYGISRASYGATHLSFSSTKTCVALSRGSICTVSSKIASELWLDIARHAAVFGDRVRNEEPVPADDLKVFGSDFTQIIGRPRVRKHVADALQLTSLWLHENAERHPTLTFYGA